ncbi:MAG: type II/IV secretion system ATPase subunit [Candidatus Thermoplasmatota archaeon]
MTEAEPLGTPFEEGTIEARRTRTSAKAKFLRALVGKGRSVKVMLPKGERERFEGDVVVIPKIAEKHISEIELQPAIEKYSYVRIKYDNITNEYLYEAIEPQLMREEEDILDVMKELLVDVLEAPKDALLSEGGIEDLERLKPLREIPALKEEYLRKAVDTLLHDLGISLHPVSKERIIYYILRDFLRYGPIDAPMIDPEVEDISCDGINIPIYIYHRKYGSIQSNLRFTTEEELDSFVVWLAQKCGKHISVAEPMLDATIPDGSRLQATLGTHVTKRGSSFTVRRFKENPFTPLDLIRFKTMSTDMMAYLWLCIENGKSMLVCGGTASGKTTTLNAILLFIPPQMKIVSIEDTRELNLPHENWVPLLTRSGFGGETGGRTAGEIDMFELLTAALRQRPQYMMVGEVRGSEAYVVFQAMATGKSAYTTFHAEDVQSMVHRMEQPPIEIPRALIAALNLVLMQAQVKVGTKMTRRVKSLTEIVGLDPETNELISNSVYSWNPADDMFNYSGHSYIYEQIAMAKNWTPKEMQREVKRRVDMLSYMQKAGFNNYRQVARLVSAYYKDRDKVMEEVRSFLKEGENNSEKA